jgi:Skp family chaperone for outer membrane proteins
MLSRVGLAFIFAALAWAMLEGFGPGAAAQTLPPAVVAVVDTQLLLRESSAAKDVIGQIKKIRSGYQAEITRQEEALREAEKELLRQRTILAPEAFAQKGRAFQDKVKDLRQYVANAERAVAQAQVKALDEIDRTIVTILNELSAEFGFNLVLDASQTRMFFKNLSLTQQVLELLDQRLPAVAVKLAGEQ